MKKILLILLFPLLAQAQNVSIPDANFLAKLISLGIDTNGDMVIQQSEAAVVTDTLDISNSAIYSLTGITAFTGLHGLNCSNNHISLLSLNNMPNLEQVTADHNYLTNVALAQLPQLAKLIISDNNNYNGSGLIPLLPSLKILDISHNFLPGIDLSGAPGLKVLIASSCLSGTINVTGLSALEHLDCSFNLLMTQLDITGLTNLKYLSADNANLTNFNASMAPALEELIISNNTNLTSLTLTGLTNLKTLYCGNTNIGSLDTSIFPNIEILDCHNANLSLLDVGELVHLTQLDCAQNHLATLDVSGLAALTTLNCNENLFDNLDVSGLSALTQLGAYGNNLSTVTLGENPNLYFLNLYDNDLSALDVSSLPALKILFCSQNHLSSIDVSQNHLLEQLVISENLLTTLDASQNHHLVWISISNNPFLESLFMKNGSPVLIQGAYFSGLPLLNYVCADEFQAQDIANMFASTGNTAVTVNSYCSFVPGNNYDTITGTLRFDVGGNGCDSADPVQAFMKVNITDGITSGADFTSQAGSYHFYVPVGNYTLAPEFENPSYFNVSPPSASAVFTVADGSTSNNDFCLTATGVNPDLEIVIAPVTPARPGFNAVYKIVYRNKGNQVMSQPYGVSFFYNQNFATYLNASVTPTTNGSGSLTWDYTNLNPFESRSILVTLHINTPTGANPVDIGDVLDFNAAISPIGGDMEMTDNYSVYHQTVVSSFDPNDIYCVEGDVVPPSEIGNYLHYIINFENTGNYPAENIVVKEVIDTTKFDLSSLQFLDSSHPVDIRLHDNIAEMIFQDINLDTGGHGNVMLKIKTNNDLVSGNMVSKKANIYFDYNAPVTTNMANTIFQTLSVPGAVKDASITVFPIPTTGFVTVKADNPITSVEVYDIAGRLLEVVKQNEAELKLDLSQRASGTYFLKIQTAQGISVEKVTKK